MTLQELRDALAAVPDEYGHLPVKLTCPGSQSQLVDFVIEACNWPRGGTFLRLGEDDASGISPIWRHEK